jgi:DNA-binding NtrC family response regulator
MPVPSPETVRRPSILLVDDERSYLEMLRKGLQAEFEIEIAEGAEEAELRMSLKHYDVIVCDHLMPGEPGLDFLVRVSDMHPRTRRILMTGYINPELLSRSVAVARLSLCLLKPVGVTQLSQALRDTLKNPPPGSGSRPPQRPVPPA